MDHEIKNLLFNIAKAIYTNKQKAFPLLKTENKKKFWEICKKNCISGYVLENFYFNDDCLKFREKLKNLSFNYVARYMKAKNDAINISTKLQKQNIKYCLLKGMALNIANLQNPKQRFCKDIDFLVPKDQINTSYEIIKSAGFKYLNPEVRDSSNHCHFHHLPVLINKDGITIELHRRITNVKDYKSCPLSENAILHRKLDNLSGVFVPSNESIVKTSIYHALKNDEPMNIFNFISDLKNLSHQKNYKEFNNVDIEDLNLDENRRQIYKSLFCDKNIFLEAPIDKCKNELFNHFESRNRKRRYRKGFSPFIHKIKSISHHRQLGIFSFAYIRALMKKFSELVGIN